MREAFYPVIARSVLSRHCEEISAPLVWFPRLSQATQKQLANWELLGDGEGIHWPDIDEDLSVVGLLFKA